MTEKELQSLKHFSKQGDAVFKDPVVLENTDFNMMLIMDEFRGEFPYSCIIHCAFDKSPAHVSNSRHYVGDAIDFHFNTDISLLEQTAIFLNFLKKKKLLNKVGLGTYPCWVNVGFHFDTRGYKARWSRINGVYVSFDEGIEYMKEKGI